ncbi:MAG TPA: IS110 family transposase [Gemmatimonadales bacterium]|nr:IS110 family transposase [Gemmatimonadales bacterium]
MFPVHVGIDTGKSFHQLVARGPAGERTKPRKVPVTRADFEAADRFLRESFPGIRPEQMLVGVELAGHHGLTFAHFLAGLGYRLVNVLPSVTKRLKEVEDNSPQKDDAKDAGQICGLLASGFFVTFAQLAEPEAELRVLTTERERLTREATRLKNRLQAVLDVCWPEFVGEFCAIDKPTPRALLERWPVAADLAQAAPQAVHHLVRTVSRNHIPPAQIRRLLALAKGSVAVPHGLAARRTEVRRILARWALVDEQLAAIDAQLAPLVEQHRGAKALTSVPGIGVVAAASIIAELGTPGSYESPRQVLKLAGMNLAGPSSGTSVRGRVRQTKRGRPALRRQLFLLAGRWCQRRGLYRAQYLAYRARGQSQTEAICAVARKLVPMLLQIAQTGQLFDLARWGAAHRVPTPAPGTRTDTTEPRTAATAQGGRPNRAA